MSEWFIHPLHWCAKHFSFSYENEKSSELMQKSAGLAKSPENFLPLTRMIPFHWSINQITLSKAQENIIYGKLGMQNYKLNRVHINCEEYFERHFFLVFIFIEKYFKQWFFSFSFCAKISVNWKKIREKNLLVEVKSCREREYSNSTWTFPIHIVDIKTLKVL